MTNMHEREASQELGVVPLNGTSNVSTAAGVSAQAELIQGLDTTGSFSIPDDQRPPPPAIEGLPPPPSESQVPTMLPGANKRSVWEFIREHKVGVAAASGFSLLAFGIGATRIDAVANIGRHQSAVMSVEEQRKQEPDFDPATDPTTGVIRPAMILPDDSLLAVTRMNGDSIKVPRLRDPSDPELFMSSLMGLFACALSADAESRPACLASITSDPDLQAEIMRERDKIYVPRYEHNLNDPDLQVTPFDNPESPAKFSKKTEGDQTVITLTGGDLFWSTWRADDGYSVWQGPETHNFGQIYAWPVTALKVTVDESSGSPEVVGWTWSYTSKHVR